MKIVKVTYTTKAGFAEQNKANISNVMSELRKLNNPGIRYDALVGTDGVSFTHFAYFRSDEDQAVLNQLGAFKHFQEQLKALGLETPPKQELLILVGSSIAVFNS